MKRHAFLDENGVVACVVEMSEKEGERISKNWHNTIVDVPLDVEQGWTYDGQQFLPPAAITPVIETHQLVVVNATAPTDVTATVNKTEALLIEGDRLVLRLQVRAPGKTTALKTFQAGLNMNWTTGSGRERLVSVVFENGVGVLKTTFKESGRWRLTPAEIQVAFSGVLKDIPILFEGYTASVRALETE